MADDKIERQIAFIIDQQAKNTVNIARLDEKLDRLEGQVSRLTLSVSQLTEQTDRVADTVGHLTEDMVMLKDAMLSLINVVEKHDERITILVEQSKDTDARFREILERLRKIDERSD